MKDFNYLFKDDAVWGEQEVVRFRWVLIGAILLLIAYIFSSGHTERGLISLALATFYIFYNAIINILLKKVGNASWIKFLSSTIDVTVLTIHIYNYSALFSPIAVATAASTFLYSILILLSVLRYDGRLVIFTSIYVVFCYNLIYLIRRPYIDPELIEQVASTDWAGQLYKSVYFLLMGYFLFSIPKMIDRLVKKQSLIIDERKNMELKLALEQQKRDLAIQKLQMEKNLNKQLSEQKILIEDQKNTLQDLNSTKDKLFSIIGHDLRSPFSAQSSLSELLIQDFDNFSKKEILESLKAINNSAKNGLELLSNLLDWAKTQHNLTELKQDALTIEPLVNDALNLLSNNLRNKRISVNKNIDPDILVNADENMIRTIIRNLLSNAIKYSHQKSQIDINCFNENGFARLEIVDYGIGIEAEQLRTLFSLQKSTSTLGTDNEPGTGLGLILCKELAEKNMGKISAESEIGKGSKFILLLPVEQQSLN
ncbi:MAG: HAMP domain-containing histidine kinase [Marinilabiliaceae bacterium]|nr:HAMP domain-containing histidine kinase [Marinilabiliaceae bacterium]